jgi:hypothetical protein
MLVHRPCPNESIVNTNELDTRMRSKDETCEVADLNGPRYKQTAMTFSIIYHPLIPSRIRLIDSDRPSSQSWADIIYKRLKLSDRYQAERRSIVFDNVLSGVVCGRRGPVNEKVPSSKGGSCK